MVASASSATNKKQDMKIEVFAICYNEEIMLPYFLRHYSQFCDKITIYDNYSTDRTDEICQANPKVEVIQYDSGNQIRDDIYLQIKNNCWKGSSADWVIVCDIDEIVWGIAPGLNGIGARILIDEVNNNIDQYTVISPDWWEMVGDRIPTGFGQIYHEIYEGRCHGQETKCIMFRPDRIREINYDPGCHGIHAEGDVRVLHTSALRILHYKYLSAEYVIERHQMFGQRLSAINRQNKWGVQYDFAAEQTWQYWRQLQEQKTRAI